MTTAAQPLPPIQQDPGYLRANELRTQHTAIMQELRIPSAAIPRMVQMSAMTLAHSGARIAFQGVIDDFDARVKARILWLEDRHPVGPAIGESTSAADRQVLLTAFRASLIEARGASHDERLQMYRDGRTFGDQNLQRAAITSMLEDGQRDAVLELTKQDDPAAADALAEWSDLQARFGQGTTTAETLFIAQAFKNLVEPAESTEFRNHVVTFERTKTGLNPNDPDIAHASLQLYHSAMRKIVGRTEW